MIDRIHIHPVELPMGRPFTHAGSARSRTASVLVTLEAGGHRGWGEAAPRPYVTGETMRSVIDALSLVDLRALAALIDVTDFPTAMRDLARADLTGLLSTEQRMPAAAAALEIALFDLICRLHDRDGLSGLRCVPAVAPLLAPVASPTPVSFVLDLTDPETAIARLSPGAVDAIRHVKLKATADIDDCVHRVAVVRKRFAPETRICVDANGAWDRSLALYAVNQLRPLGIAWLEEPVAARDWTTMREIRAAGIPVMLDESCTGPADLHAAVAAGAVDYVNARISKTGGIFPTLALIAAARDLGVGAQLGVHVGEIGPLWAAARLLSCAIDGLATVEAGKQDEWFAEPLTEPPYAVDRENYLAAPIGGVGIGVVPSAALLRHCTPHDRGGQP